MMKGKLRGVIRKAGMPAVYIIAAGFALIVLIGSLLLTLPQASQTGHSIGWFDALFTSTSAVCVTGLVVRDTGTTFTLYGQIVLLILIQVGGLGFMTFATMLFRAIGRQITLRDRMLISESMNENRLGGMEQLIWWVVRSTLFVEAAGAVLFSLRFVPLYGWGQGLFYSLFHAVSAFCNAGFDLLGGYQSFTGFRADALINFTAMALIICGGLGFGVLRELGNGRHRKQPLRLHTRLVLTSYGVLMAFGFLFTLVAEWSNPATLGNLNFFEKLLAALFQSVTLRTAGFNTIEQGALHPATRLVGCILMVIGASPASTGGGVKVTTAAVAFLIVRMAARGDSGVTVFHRRLKPDLLQRAMAVLLIAVSVMLADTVVISLIQPELDFMDVMYECASAIGTVGLSAFGSVNLATIPRILIILTMYIGRIGPMTMALLIAHRQGANASLIQYPYDHVMIG